MSNHPAPLAGLSDVSSVNVSIRPSVNTHSVVSSVASYSKSAEKSAPVPSREVRDELVRAVMPELRLLMEHLVNTAVEHSIAPLLDKQRELEAALKNLQSAQNRPAPSTNTSSRVNSEIAIATRSVPIEENPFVPYAAQTSARQAVIPMPAASVARPVVSVRAEVVTATVHDTDTLLDIPAELNGSRRTKTLIIAFAVVAAVIILTVIGLSVASNLGTHL